MLRLLPARKGCEKQCDFATMCREDATCAGLPAKELRTAAQDDLIRSMLAALDEAARPATKPPPQSFLPRVLAQIRRKSVHRGGPVS
jgi:hypothetical protein